jgi:hypothetical protein
MHHFVLLQWMEGISPSSLASPYIVADGGKRAAGRKMAAGRREGAETAQHWCR